MNMDKVLRFMQRTGFISPKLAKEREGIVNLRADILKLRNLGYGITTQRVKGKKTETYYTWTQRQRMDQYQPVYGKEPAPHYTRFQHRY